MMELYVNPKCCFTCTNMWIYHVLCCMCFCIIKPHVPIYKACVNMWIYHMWNTISHVIDSHVTRVVYMWIIYESKMVFHMNQYVNLSHVKIHQLCANIWIYEMWNNVSDIHMLAHVKWWFSCYRNVKCVRTVTVCVRLQPEQHCVLSVTVIRIICRSGAHVRFWD